MKSEIKANDIVLCRRSGLLNLDTYVRVQKVKGTKIYGKLLSSKAAVEMDKPVLQNEVIAFWEPSTITSDQVKDIITGKITMDDLGLPYPYYCCNMEKKITISPAEMLEGLENILNLYDEDRLEEYLDFLSDARGKLYDLMDDRQINGGIRFLPESIFKVSQILDDMHTGKVDAVFEDFLDFLDELDADEPYEWDDDDEDDFDDIWSDRNQKSIFEDAFSLKAVLQEIADRMSVPVEEREFEEDDLASFLYHYLDPSVAQDASDAEILFTRNLIEDMIEQGNALAMMAKARACGGGSRLYDCDWLKAESLLKQAFDLTHSPTTAIDLGILYSEGQTTGGVPQLDQAFFYLCMADHSRLPAASLQICRLYINEKFAGYNPVLASVKADMVCNDTRESFLKGEKSSYYPDAALQLAECMNVLPAQIQDPYLTARCLMTAVFGIRLRSLTSDSDKDTLTAAHAQHLLDQCLETADREAMEARIYDSIEELLSAVTFPKAILHLKGKENKNGNWKITVRHVEHDDDLHAGRFFQVLPEYGFAGFTDKLIIRSDGMLNALVDDEYEESFDLYADEVREDTFFLAGKEVLSLEGEMYIGKPEYPKNRRYLMASVSDDVPDTTFECICDSTSICAGDTVDVLVDGYKMQDGTVEAVYWKNDWELSYSPDDHLHVRKSDQ